MLEVMLCEGKHDAWFFDEILKESSGRRALTFPDFGMDKLQSTLKEGCLSFIKSQYSSIIFGDGGRPTIYNKTLQRIVVETLGKYSDDICINLIIDDDGTEYQDLREVILNKLQSLVKNRLKFTKLPEFEYSGETFIISHPNAKGTLTIELFNVPLCLETQVAKKFIETKCPKTSIIVEENPHDAIKMLAKDYYGGDIEKLIRDTSRMLKDDMWVKKIVGKVS